LIVTGVQTCALPISGDLLISQTLRDAAATAGALVSDRPAAVAQSIAELGDRLDADLWLFRDGVLAGTSAPVLGELGLVDPFLAQIGRASCREGVSRV